MCSDRVSLQQVAASALEQFTILQNSSSTLRRANREAHPRAFLSTRQRSEDPGDTPASTSSRTVSSQTQVVTSSCCRVSRQRSTPVDLPPADHPESPDANKTIDRPATLCLVREISRTSSSGSQGVATPCPEPTLSPDVDGRQLVSSYPPGPEACRLQRPTDHCTRPGPRGCCLVSTWSLLASGPSLYHNIYLD